jgi:DNA-binding response OmpR family regulator
MSEMMRDFMKLLVIDDQEEVGDLIGEIASQSGWESALCTSVDHVYELIEREKVNLLFLDFFMPEKNGLEILTELRAKGCNVLTVLCSGMISEINPARAKELGVIQIMEKPIGIDQLRAILNYASKSIKP